MSTKPPVFLSYARVDLTFARRLAADLKAAGANVWLDKADIRPGSQWDREVEKALAACTEVLVILSPASVESTNVMDEVAFALEEGKTVIPVIQSECRIPFRLRRLQHIDFSSGYELAIKDLLEVLVVEHQAGRGVQRAADTADAMTPLPKTPSPEVSLFPLYGITLGVTTKSELAKFGKRVASIDDATGKLFPYYVYQGVDFWYDKKSNLVDRMYLSKNRVVPGPWETIGFRWQNPYDQWLSWLENLGYWIRVGVEPHVESFDGHDSFAAQIIARKLLPHPHKIDLNFKYSRGTKTDSTGTLYSVSFIASDQDASGHQSP